MRKLTENQKIGFINMMMSFADLDEDELLERMESLGARVNRKIENAGLNKDAAISSMLVEAEKGLYKASSTLGGIMNEKC